MDSSSSRHILTLLILTLSSLVLLSLLPWSDITGNVVKDFNLLEDLFPNDKKRAASAAMSVVDPELEQLLAENSTDANDLNNPSGLVSADTIVSDSARIDSTAHLAPVTAYEEAPVADGVVVFENYAMTPSLLPNFKQALAQTGSRTVRIAVIGDSFIEGDIFCQDLREMMQQRYGGSGVGFVALHNEFPGFRQSVRQTDSGWKLHDIRQMGASDSLRTLSADYSKAQTQVKSTYKGAQRMPHAAYWDKSTFVFIAPDSGTITLKAGSENVKTIPVTTSGSVRSLSIEGRTQEFAVESNIPGLIGLGVYLDATSGVQVDCMSIRGNSGIGLRKLNAGLCRQMAAIADYDLIILEFGINALSAEQTDYTSYSIAMTKAVHRLQSIYPHADIIIMGISDRGIKNGTDIASLPTSPAMTKAQRNCARNAGAVFWDTRAAMGGEGAALEWRRRNLLNADYIHLNHAGGRELAKLFVKALEKAIDE